MIHKNSFIKIIKGNIIGWLFLLPLLLGIVLFTFMPMVSSLYYSFFDYNIISEPVNFGLQNYQNVLFGDESELFWKAMGNTFIYTLTFLPLSTILGYLLALTLTKNTSTNRFFRILYYLPALMPGIVSALVWNSILNTKFGLLNGLFVDVLGGEAVDFFAANSLMPTYIVMNLFGIGGGVVMWIAQINAIPQTLYEAAELDGANKFKCFLNITLPMSTPMIFYKIITGIIASLQIFEGPYILTGGNGGTEDALLFVVMRIYNTAFDELNFGVASAMSWILFLFIGVISVIVFKTKKWVYYAEEE